MVTQVHRTRPFVDPRTGALTQWGWNVLNDLRGASGGPQTTPGEFVLFSTVFSPSAVFPEVTPGTVFTNDIGPVFIDRIGPDDIGPA